MVVQNNLFDLSPADQLAALRVDLGELAEFNSEFVDRQLPDKAVNLFVVPEWSLLGASYIEALDKVHAALTGHLDFVDGLTLSHNEIMNRPFLRPQYRTSKAWQNIVASQQSRVMIIPAQFCGHYQETGFRNLYTEKMNRDNEFGLDPYTVAVVLLSHRHLFAVETGINLAIRCAGAYFPPRSPSDADSSSILYQLKAGANRQELFMSSKSHNFSDAAGWATGFII